MRCTALAAVVLTVALCIAPRASVGQSDSKATVTTTFALYGPQVEPFDGNKENAIKTALAQSAGHGVTTGDISINVIKTYTDQQKGRRRLLQDNKLVQPGVLLTSDVQTTQQLATSVGQSIDSALGNNQMAQIFNQNGGQADYTSLVAASATGGSSGSGSASGNNNSGGSSNTGNKSSGSSNSSNSSGGSGGGGSSFPGWAIAIVIVLVLLLVGIVVGYYLYRRRAANRGVQAATFQSDSYFNDSTDTGGMSNRIAGAWSSVSAGAAGLAAKFKRAPPVVVPPPTETQGAGMMRNPATPFSQIGFTGAGASGTGIPRPSVGGSGDKYSGFVTRATTPKGASTPNPLYNRPTTPNASGYNPRRTGRLESLRDINDI